MTDIYKEVEFAVRVKNAPTTLVNLLDSMSAQDIEILARGTHSDGESTVVSLVTDNTPKTQRVLEQAGLSYTTESVVLVDVENVGDSSVRYAALLRSEGIRVLHSYV